MKVRFYRGPYDGKVRHVDDSALHRGVIQVAEKPKLADLYSGNYWDQVTVNKHTYEMRMLSIQIGHTVYKAPAMHPDGSVYYEWTKKRGSKK